MKSLDDGMHYLGTKLYLGTIVRTGLQTDYLSVCDVGSVAGLHLLIEYHLSPLDYRN